jgi:hypothetical protein
VSKRFQGQISLNRLINVAGGSTGEDITHQVGHRPLFSATLDLVAENLLIINFHMKKPQIPEKIKV